jgi:two-component system sensor histidine kinase KdpD
LLDLAIFVAATAGTYVAQSYERPVTAVLVYLTGVIWIAVRSGLLPALGAAALASMIYNFFISEPVFKFGVTSLDEAVPLLAFNATAMVTGLLVGRLRDAALREKKASGDAAFMLTISNSLQTALHVGDVATIIRDLLSAQGLRSVQILLSSGDLYARPVVSSPYSPISGAWNGLSTQAEPDSLVVLKLEGARGSLGIVRFVLAGGADRRFGHPDLVRSPRF